MHDIALYGSSALILTLFAGVLIAGLKQLP